MAGEAAEIDRNCIVHGSVTVKFYEEREERDNYTATRMACAHPHSNDIQHVHGAVETHIFDKRCVHPVRELRGVHKALHTSF